MSGGRDAAPQWWVHYRAEGGPDAEEWLSRHDRDYSALRRSWSGPRPGGVALEDADSVSTSTGKVLRGKCLGYRFRRSWESKPPQTVWATINGASEPWYIGTGDTEAVAVLWETLAVAAGRDPQRLSRQRNAAYDDSAVIVAQIIRRGARPSDVATVLDTFPQRVSERLARAADLEGFRSERGQLPKATNAVMADPRQGSVYVTAGDDVRRAAMHEHRYEMDHRPWWSHKFPFADAYVDEGTPTQRDLLDAVARKRVQLDRAARIRARRRQLGHHESLPAPHVTRCGCKRAKQHPVFTRASLLEQPRILAICAACGAVNGRKPEGWSPLLLTGDVTPLFGHPQSSKFPTKEEAA